MAKQAGAKQAGAKLARAKQPVGKASVGKASSAPRRSAVKSAAGRKPKPAASKVAGRKAAAGRIKTIAVPTRELAKSAKPSFFRMRSQLLDAGNTELPLATGDNLWVKIKVYAKGGENHLHMHPYQDHSFIVLDGKACFYGPRGELRTLKRHEGIFLPAGAYYWFEQVGKAPLVLLRIGATRPGGHPDTRVMPDGEWRVRRGRDETYISPDVAYRPGAFYE